MCSGGGAGGGRGGSGFAIIRVLPFHTTIVAFCFSKEMGFI